ncbi:MAG: energy transducer TonB [Candidatus Omnitrophica bacterium]|nr:energy transducer TonB [Candidatus Omnitrophota bacterium]
MKLPFSYKQHVFNSILVSSFIGHVTLIGFGSFFSPSPEYAVEQAPSSMEVVILNQRDIKKEKQKIEAVMTLKNLDTSPEIQKKEQPRKELIKKAVYIPPVKGAVTQTKPAYLKNPSPIYPNRAREQGWQGVVVLKVLVSENGGVDQIKIYKSSGYGILDESALKTIRTWQFLPARVGIMSFSSWIKIPVRFLLTEKERE